MNSDIYKIEWMCKCIDKKKLDILMHETTFFSHYWGRYLEEIDNFWIYEKSNYYETCYIQGCKMIASELQKKKEYEKAVVLYKNILHIDSFNEEIMTELLTCYCEMGDWKCLRETHDKFICKFKRDMGIDSVVSMKKILEETQKNRLEGE